MKLKYTALLLAAVSTAAQAQYATKRPAMPGPASAQPARTVVDVPASMAKAAGDTVWNEDFANGFSGNNPSGAWTTGEADGNWWVYTQTGPIGAYSNNGEAITSATAANGWMIFQADSGNSTFGGGAPTPNGTFVDWDGALVSPIIDLSATPYVRLSFTQSQRFCCGTAPEFLQVSSDGGATWPTSYAVISEAVNADNGPYTTSINISNGIVGNPAQARFRFFFNGSVATSSHYHWQVDDVNIIEVFDYDLVMQNAASHNFDPALSFTYDSLRYSVYPYSQLRPVPLNMTVLNNGSVNQTNVTANFLVEEGATTVLDQDQVIPAFPGGTIQNVYVDPDFTPPATTGTYDVTYNIESSVTDLVPGDNSATSTFKVDPYSYGRDLGVASSQETGDDLGGAYELCNIFHISYSTDLYAISAAFRAGTGMAGSVVRGSIRNVDADFTLIDNTEEYDLVTADLNTATQSKFVDLVFANPVTLDVDVAYMVCVEHFGSANPFRTGANGVSEDQTSFIFFDPPGAQTLAWYYTTTTPMVRMNFNPAAGITEGAASQLALRAAPSMFTDNTTVRFMHEGGSASWSLLDVSGRLLRTADMGQMGAGNQSIAIDGTGLAAGQYTLRVVSNGAAASVKLLKAAH